LQQHFATTLCKNTLQQHLATTPCNNTLQQGFASAHSMRKTPNAGEKGGKERKQKLTGPCPNQQQTKQENKSSQGRVPILQLHTGTSELKPRIGVEVAYEKCFFKQHNCLW